MRLEAADPKRSRPFDAVEMLNLRFRDASAEDVIAGVRAEFGNEVALVSSFGAEAAVLLHLASRVDTGLPVLFIDTLMLFEETLEYQKTLSKAFGLTNVIHLRTDSEDLEEQDPDWTLHKRDPDACCHIRKVRPLERALDTWSVVVSGRKRYQASTRSALEIFEADGDRLKVNPLAHWNAQDLKDYMDRHDLPRHPLVAKGYPSIGCAPCTTRVREGEDPRAGRWRGSNKVECGIHFGADGRILRAS
ncbi:phosphoadenylyl-sulfate reductase [Amaricoccus macauensis]|uniref:phosphoadenylyl-sulfate reductase n=1 Tax=Amaricoccus macauensis TaxID=57001 RepID=UPI003C7C6518